MPRKPQDAYEFRLYVFKKAKYDLNALKGTIALLDPSGKQVDRTVFHHSDEIAAKLRKMLRKHKRPIVYDSRGKKAEFYYKK